jgi:hypothetical protein
MEPKFIKVYLSFMGVNMIPFRFNRYYPIIFFLTLFISFHLVFADGGFFPVDIEDIGNTAESPNQRAIIIHDGQKETMIIQVKYSGNVRDFAWVIPMPSLPDENSIQVEGDSIFTLLHEGTQPKVYRVSSSNYGWGGGGRLGNESGELEEIPSAQVKVWHNLAVGPYQVEVISGTSIQALSDWLNNHGYNYPTTVDAVLDFYIQKSWYFMATKVMVESQANKNNSTFQAGLPGLKVTFPTDKPVFPLRISEISSAKENEIQVYVVASHRMISDSYNTYAMDRDEVESLIKAQIEDAKSNGNTGAACACPQVIDPVGSNSSDYDYESIFRQKLSHAGKQTFMVEHASNAWTSWDYNQEPTGGTFNGFFNPYFPEGSDFWITRFRTILTPEEMTDDVTFIPDPGGDEWLILDVYIEERNPWNVSALGLPLLFLLPIIFSNKIRQRYWKHALMVVFILYLIGI